MMEGTYTGWEETDPEVDARARRWLLPPAPRFFSEVACCTKCLQRRRDCLSQCLDWTIQETYVQL